MRKLMFAAVITIVTLTFQTARAQQIDAAFGVSTTEAPPASDATNSSNYAPQSLRGGAYVGFSGDVLLKKSFGIGGEINWRAGQALYFSNNQNYRPIYWDINGVYAPSITKNLSAELQAGIGAQTVRYYNNDYVCGGCTNYNSDNQFMGHFGGGLRVYLRGNVFIRPEAHIYLVNNNQYFSSFHTERYGVSIGYSFGKRDKDRYGY